MNSGENKAMLAMPGRQREQRKIRNIGAVLLGGAALLWGCGSSSSVTAQPKALTIIQQPTDQTTPLGQTATFQVVAQGPGALSYQWSMNGNPVTGATGPSYTTAVVTAEDSGATYTVLVSSKGASVTSDAAKLTVGPRSPAEGDLRFQQVGAKSTLYTAGYGSFVILWYPMGQAYSDSAGTPLRLGLGQCVENVKQDCGWQHETWAVPQNLSHSAGYFPDLPENLDNDLKYYASDGSVVVTSLDIESNEDVFGISWAKGPASGFDYRHETTPLSGLLGLIAKDGSNGRVVTAVSFNDATGQIDLLSYGWASDTSTIYDTDVLTSSYDDIGATFTTLANAGYILTAFGGNGTDGYILVGTKVHGDSLPRPILISPPGPISTQSYALVGWAINTGYGAPDSPPIWLYEK